MLIYLPVKNENSETRFSEGDVVYLHKAGNIHMQHDESQPRIIIMIMIQKPTPTNAARIGLFHSGMPKLDFEVEN